jgi:hypothetical protein
MSKMVKEALRSKPDLTQNRAAAAQYHKVMLTEVPKVTVRICNYALLVHVPDVLTIIASALTRDVFEVMVFVLINWPPMSQAVKKQDQVRLRSYGLQPSTEANKCPNKVKTTLVTSCKCYSASQKRHRRM